MSWNWKMAPKALKTKLVTCIHTTPVSEDLRALLLHFCVLSLVIYSHCVLMMVVFVVNIC